MAASGSADGDPLGALISELSGYAHLSRNWDGRGGEPFEPFLIFEVLRYSEMVLEHCRRHSQQTLKASSTPHSDGSIETEFTRGDRALSLRLDSKLQLQVQHKGGPAAAEILVYRQGLAVAVEQAASALCA